MQTVFQPKTARSLGDVGLDKDVYEEFELKELPEGFDFLDSAPRSSISTAAAITFDWDRDGKETIEGKLLEDPDNLPILDAYMLHDYGCFKGRFSGDEEQVLLVPVSCPEDRDFEKQTRGVVRIHLNADPAFRYLEDVPPNHVLSAMETGSKEADNMLLEREAFRFEEREKRREAKKAAERQEVEDAVSDSPAAPAEQGTAPAAPDKAAPAIENEPAQREEREFDFSQALAKAADMSATHPLSGKPFESELYNAAVAYAKLNAHKQVVMIGAVLPYAVKAGFLTLDNVAELLQAMVRDVDPGHRISALGVEELRPDRWRIELWCREGGGQGRARSAHLVHLTAAAFAMDYRVTGPKKYPHQLEILEHIKLCLDRVLTVQF